tara:strand:+ start:180 stop:380 length:201 start_codon:yes stop_codon:yes gene_type:complete
MNPQEEILVPSEILHHHLVEICQDPAQELVQVHQDQEVGDQQIAVKDNLFTIIENEKKSNYSANLY